MRVLLEYVPVYRNDEDESVKSSSLPSLVL